MPITKKSLPDTPATATTSIRPCNLPRRPRYFFKLFALDSEVDLPGGVNRSGVLKAMEGHIIEQDELIGLYQRG
ncbi:MAG: hypothetical protein ABR523_00440 [Desulfurivibrionaceae bacterium]